MPETLRECWDEMVGEEVGVLLVDEHSAGLLWMTEVHEVPNEALREDEGFRVAAVLEEMYRLRRF